MHKSLGEVSCQQSQIAPTLVPSLEGKASPSAGGSGRGGWGREREVGQDLPSHALVRHVEEVHVVLGWGPCLVLVPGVAGGKSRGRGAPRLLLGHLVGVPLGPAIAAGDLGAPVPAGSWNTPSQQGALQGAHAQPAPPGVPHLGLPSSPLGAGGALREGAGRLLPPLPCAAPFLVGSGGTQAPR